MPRRLVAELGRRRSPVVSGTVLVSPHRSVPVCSRCRPVAGSRPRTQQLRRRAVGARAGCRRWPPWSPGCARSGPATIGDQLVRRVAGGEPVRPPVVGQPDLVDRARPARSAGRIRSVTSTRASIAVRAVTIVAQPPCSSPRSAASSGRDLAEELRLELGQVAEPAGSSRRRCGARSAGRW